jgi:hypothetical protein
LFDVRKLLVSCSTFAIQNLHEIACQLHVSCFDKCNPEPQSVICNASDAFTHARCLLDLFSPRKEVTGIAVSKPSMAGFACLAVVLSWFSTAGGLACAPCLLGLGVGGRALRVLQFPVWPQPATSRNGLALMMLYALTCQIAAHCTAGDVLWKYVLRRCGSTFHDGWFLTAPGHHYGVLPAPGTVPPKGMQ